MPEDRRNSVRDEILADVEKRLEEEKRAKPRRRRRFGAGKTIVCAFLLLLFVYLGLYINGRSHFETVFYQLPSRKTEEQIRLVCLTDLHNWTFGRDNDLLISRIIELNPDIVLIAGDMVTAGEDDISVAVSICRQLAQTFPVYYSFGNHENEMVYSNSLTIDFLESYEDEMFEKDKAIADFSRIPMADPRLPDALTEVGVTLLNNQTASIEVKGCKVDLIGLNVESGAYHRYSKQLVNRFLTQEPQNLKLLIAHKPAIYNVISLQENLRYDLLLCGHTHGGIIRLPGVGGLIRMAGEGFWKEGQDAGLIKREQGYVFLGRGLGNSNPLPRIGNPPELAVIDIY